nr:tetratricopeptide repeat protein [Gemmatimonadota bacterium]
MIQDRGRAFSPKEAIAEGAAPGIAVLPFSVQSAELEEWREGMVDLVSTNLDGVAGLRTIDSRTVLARWREAVPGNEVADLETALDVGRRAGARYVLLGSAVAIGGGVRLSADVYDTGDGSKLGQGTVDGAPDSVFALVDRLSIEVLRAVLRGQERDLPTVNLARVTTTSLPALKAYLQGEVLFREGDFEAAIPAYERAVEADSTFALAHYRLAHAHGWSAIQGDLTQEAIERAARFADRLPERERVVVLAERALLQGSLDGIEPLEELVRRYPDDVEAWYTLGDTYFHLGEQTLIDPLEEGTKAFARATELDPTFAPAYIHQIDTAIYESDSARAAGLIATYDRLASGSEMATALRFAFALALGDSATRAKTWAALDTTSVSLEQGIYYYLMSTAHLKLHAEIHEKQIQAAGPGRAGGATFSYSWIITLLGRPAEALRTADSPEFPAESAPDFLYYLHARGLPIPLERLQRTLALDAIDSENPVHLLYAGAYAAERGEWQDHAAAIRQLRESAGISLAAGDSVEARFGEGAAGALEGYAAWRRGQREEALRLLRSSERVVTGHVFRHRVNQTIRWWIGDLLEEMGRPSEAARYFYSVTFNDP